MIVIWDIGAYENWFEQGLHSCSVSLERSNATATGIEDTDHLRLAKE